VAPLAWMSATVGSISAARLLALVDRTLPILIIDPTRIARQVRSAHRVPRRGMGLISISSFLSH
jgi:hypothetical protein